jgi:acyl carrier protein
MELEEIYKQITPIFRDTLDNDDVNLTPETNAGEIEEWDSLSHILLVVGVESHFGIKFNSVEIAELQNVGEFVSLIHDKIDS